MAQTASQTPTLDAMYALARRHGTEPELDQIMIGAAWACSRWEPRARGGFLVNGFPTRRGLFSVNVARLSAPLSLAEIDDLDAQWAYLLPRFRRWWTTQRARGERGPTLAGHVAALALPPDGLDAADAVAQYSDGFLRSYPADYADPDAAPPLIDRIFDAGRLLFGLPYAAEPDGLATLDASLFVQMAVEGAGGLWPLGRRLSVEAMRGACEVAGSGPVPWASVEPGHLLFFDLFEPAGQSYCADGRKLSHVGISYGAGSGRMMDCHAANGYRGAPGVGETDLRDDYWQARLVEARVPWWWPGP